MATKRKNLIPLEDIHVELIENGVPKNEQTMTKEKVFWAFCSPNINLTSWLFGIIAAQGLGFGWAFLAIVIGNFFGSTVVGLCGTMGPQTRLSSLEGSRFSFGRAGVKIPAILNWANSIGWDAVNNIPAAAALVTLVTFYHDLHSPFWVMLALLSLVQMSIAVYGHHLFQIISKYTGYILCAIFLFLGIRTGVNSGGMALQTTGFSPQAFMLAISIAAVGSAGYAPYAADYTRYLPANTSKKSIFLRIFSGLFLSYVVMEAFGIITASLVKEQTPDSLMAALQSVAGVFAPLVLIAAAIGVIPANAMNDNSAAYCLVSAGIRIPRPLSAAIAGLGGFYIALYGAGHLSTIVEDTILLLFYWIAPWTAIVLVHWFMSGMKEKAFEKGWTIGASIFSLVTLLTIGLFASNDLYTGPIAKMLDGADIGYYVGFFLAGFLYWLALLYQKRTIRN